MTINDFEYNPFTRKLDITDLGIINALISAGTIWDYAGFTAPSGWLLCDGTAVLRSTYSILFSAITITQIGTFNGGSAVVTGLADTSNMGIGMPVSGAHVQAGSVILTVDSGTQITMNKTATGGTSTENLVVAPFGVGDGSTTFNTPDFRGRVSIGKGTGSGLTARVLGITGGEETHALSIAELASHVHTYNRPDAITASYGTGSVKAVPTVTAGINTGSQGSGTAHNTMQPFLVTNKIIKY